MIILMVMMMMMMVTMMLMMVVTEQIPPLQPLPMAETWQKLFWDFVSAKFQVMTMHCRTNDSPHENGRNLETKRAIWIGPTPGRSQRRVLLTLIALH